jgi:hypothetical protein
MSNVAMAVSITQVSPRGTWGLEDTTDYLETPSACVSAPHFILGVWSHYEGLQFGLRHNPELLLHPTPKDEGPSLLCCSRMQRKWRQIHCCLACRSLRELDTVVGLAIVIMDIFSSLLSPCRAGHCSSSLSP